jgi:hypothetical protein
VRLFEYVLDHKPFYNAMFGGGVVSPFREQVQAYLAARSLQRLRYVIDQRDVEIPIPAELVAQFNTGAILSVLVWWVNEDFTMPADEMARYLMRLINYGNFALFQEDA